jgi:hypothetical protein
MKMKLREPKNGVETPHSQDRCNKAYRARSLGALAPEDRGVGDEYGLLPMLLVIHDGRNRLSFFTQSFI